VLTPKEAEQMRAYVVSRAHYAKTNDAALGGGSKKAVK
jgi:quinohemoprotein ethanol dehydrogenase